MRLELEGIAIAARSHPCPTVGSVAPIPVAAAIVCSLPRRTRAVVVYRSRYKDNGCSPGINEIKVGVKYHAIARYARYDRVVHLEQRPGALTVR